MLKIDEKIAFTILMILVIAFTAWGLGLESSEFDANDSIAVGDIDGYEDEDGNKNAELLIAEDSGGSITFYKVITSRAGVLIGKSDLSPIKTSYDSGDDLAVGDVDGDGIAEILIAEDNGGKIDVYRKGRWFASVGDWPHISDRNSGFDSNDAIAAGDIDGDGKAEILVAEDSDGLVRIFDFIRKKDDEGDYYYYIKAKKGGIRTSYDAGDALAAASIDGDEFAEIIVAEDNNSQLCFWDRNGMRVSHYISHERDNREGCRYSEYFDRGDDIAAIDLKADLNDDPNKLAVGYANIFIAEDNGGEIMILDDMGE